MPDTLQFLEMSNAPTDKADILILPIPLERTVSFKPGTADAPRAILDTSVQLEFYEEDAGWSPFKHMLLSVLPEFADDSALTDAELHKATLGTWLPLCLLTTCSSVSAASIH